MAEREPALKVAHRFFSDTCDLWRATRNEAHSPPCRALTNAISTRDGLENALVKGALDAQEDVEKRLFAAESELRAARAERDAERQRADRLSDARQELGVERDMLKMENEQLRGSLDPSAAEVARLRALLERAAQYLRDFPGADDYAVTARTVALECIDALDAPVGAPLAGKPEGGTP